MKAKINLLFILYLFAAFSCSEPESADPSISTVFKEITFPADGGSEDVAVLVKNIAKWDVYSTDSWITVEKDSEQNILHITALRNEDIDGHSGKVIIYSDMDETVEIAITQEGNGILFDRPTKTRLNLYGKVKSCDFYFNPIYMWAQQPMQLANIEFNEYGNMTHYEFYFITDQTTTFSANLTYDSQERLSEIEVNVDGHSSFPENYKLQFTYGNHGKYISRQNLFAPIESWNCILYEMVWMPEMIKDLTRIDLTSDYIANYIDSNSVRIEIETSGDTGAAYYYAKNQSGTEQKYLLSQYSFTGQYTTGMEFDINFVGIVIPSYVTYELEPASGYITKMTHRNDEVFGILNEWKYLPNLRNTPYSYIAKAGPYYIMTLEHNDNYDVAHLSNKNNNGNAGFEYVYDSFGNWTEITLSADTTPKPNKSIPTKRTITYYE